MVDWRKNANDCSCCADDTTLWFKVLLCQQLGEPPYECSELGIWVTQSVLDAVTTHGSAQFFMHPCTDFECCIWIATNLTATVLEASIPIGACKITDHSALTEEVDSCAVCCDEDTNCVSYGCGYCGDCDDEPSSHPTCGNGSTCPSTISFSFTTPAFQVWNDSLFSSNNSKDCCADTFPSLSGSGTLARDGCSWSHVGELTGSSGSLPYDFVRPAGASHPTLDNCIKGDDHYHPCAEPSGVVCGSCPCCYTYTLQTPVTFIFYIKWYDNSLYNPDLHCSPKPCGIWQVGLSIGLIMNDPIMNCPVPPQNVLMPDIVAKWYVSAGGCNCPADMNLSGSNAYDWNEASSLANADYCPALMSHDDDLKQMYFTSGTGVTQKFVWSEYIKGITVSIS